MASTYTSLVAQQLLDTRPSPTLEVSKTLDINSSYSPGHTPCPSFGPSSSASATASSHRKDYFEAANNSTTATALHEQPHTRPNSTVVEPVAPPSTPITSPLRQTTTTVTNNNKKFDTTTTSTPIKPTSKHQRVASQNGLPSIQVTRTPTNGVLSQPLASSPKGVSDVFSLSSDKQLSAQYWFHEEIGYGNWVSFHFTISLFCSLCWCTVLTLRPIAMCVNRAPSGRSSNARERNENWQLSSSTASRTIRRLQHG